MVLLYCERIFFTIMIEENDLPQISVLTQSPPQISFHDKQNKITDKYASQNLRGLDSEVTIKRCKNNNVFSSIYGTEDHLVQMWIFF